jgi:hypothetical protein
MRHFTKHKAKSYTTPKTEFSEHGAINEHRTLLNNVKKLTSIHTPVFVSSFDEL